MRIVISDHVADTCLALTEAMFRILNANPERDIYLAVSGGSTPASLFDLWASRFEHETDWKRIQIFWVDERCVPPSDKESNFRMTFQHLLKKVPFREKHIHRIHGEAMPEEEAARYEHLVKKRLPVENGVPVFDLILLGIGSDGHTASLFPDAMAEALSDRALYKVAEKPESKQKRITMTLPLINAAQNVFFLATGIEKAPVISDLYHQTPAFYKYPVSLINPDHGQLTCFLDRAAFSIASQGK